MSGVQFLRIFLQIARNTVVNLLSAAATAADIAAAPPAATWPLPCEDTGGAPEAKLPPSGARSLHVGGDLEVVPEADGPPWPPGAVHAPGLAGRDRSLPRPQHRHQDFGCRKGAVWCGAVCIENDGMTAALDITRTYDNPSYRCRCL